MECKCCKCPLKAGGTENLKEQAKEDFNDMLKTFFDKHPYIKSVYLSDRDTLYPQSIFIHNDSNRYISIHLK